MGGKVKCQRCQDGGWVCEAHPDRPWSNILPNGCECNAGMPCPDCNSSNGEDDPPRVGEALRSVDVGAGRVEFTRRHVALGKARKIFDGPLDEA